MTVESLLFPDVPGERGCYAYIAFYAVVAVVALLLGYRELVPFELVPFLGITVWSLASIGWAVRFVVLAGRFASPDDARSMRRAGVTLAAFGAAGTLLFGVLI